jgi:hypothetical protein
MVRYIFSLEPLDQLSDCHVDFGLELAAFHIGFRGFDPFLGRIFTGERLGCLWIPFAPDLRLISSVAFPDGWHDLLSILWRSCAK